MESRFKHTFDAIAIPDARRSQIRGELALLKQQKAHSTHAVKVKKAWAAVLAIVLVLSISAVALASDQIIAFFTGARLERTVNESGAVTSFRLSLDTDTAVPPAKVENGQILFTLDGSNRNITSFCSAAAYYKYEQVDEYGLRHIVLVGGTPQNLGYAEMIPKADGSLSGYAYYGGLPDAPQWYRNAKADLGLIGE